MKIAIHFLTLLQIRAVLDTRRSRFIGRKSFHLLSHVNKDISEEEAFQWFDEAIIFVRAGSGGTGANTFKYGKNRQHNVANGGSGGNGGDVLLEVNPSLNTLLGFRATNSFRAERGRDGRLDFANGLTGEKCVIPCPIGTVAIDNSTGVVLGELTKDGDRLVVARGGLGGKGNGATKRAKGEKAKGYPPQGGERRWIRLELKLVADVGLLGMPNAGKSTILDAITNARPKIASYAFTTITPNLGVCEVNGPNSVGSGGDAMVMCDIPGVIEGAHRGAGLGRRFLRHVERCRILLHIVNGDSVNPISDFLAINQELQLFSPVLAQKPQIVVLNKIDLPHVESRKEQIITDLRQVMTHTRLLTISGMATTGLPELVERTNTFLKKLKKDDIDMQEENELENESRLIIEENMFVQDVDDIN
mmetsp:Transcript_18562/g.18641  ORF Transcript_18562/g.18641 Transcript_18562/m.18641 type:complete len:418 (-) Transcript_18562:92-1345(-)|eukprot:CAMPEP_0182432118 /NCGR_PEP_ID=MMETSP1167-20130531/54248_1 /TAXON_ID=2988 /ORGANISM="Mallomonas Sp, Strain CCMP3275" /LENGTH=417 /DNA_ID=CAMNT_0024619257 /DNA_START=51 /DNA_END=1304 /DNA_ORIENTATION=+